MARVGEEGEEGTGQPIEAQLGLGLRQAHRLRLRPDQQLDLGQDIDQHLPCLPHRPLQLLPEGVDVVLAEGQHAPHQLGPHLDEGRMRRLPPLGVEAPANEEGPPLSRQLLELA